MIGLWQSTCSCGVGRCRLRCLCFLINFSLGLVWARLTSSLVFLFLHDFILIVRAWQLVLFFFLRLPRAVLLVNSAIEGIWVVCRDLNLLVIVFELEARHDVTLALVDRLIFSVHFYLLSCFVIR